uniref:Vacuolar fusion protein MON1 homolog n=1 Tax=Hirondellea gigas TaxID=1518452 RepID=A0A2P2I3T0_9CRUS
MSEAHSVSSKQSDEPLAHTTGHESSSSICNKEDELESVTKAVEQVTLTDDAESGDSGGYDSAKEFVDCSDQLLTNNEWLSKSNHVFILSESGKPVYSRYGSEERLVPLYGLLQALASIVSDEGDVLHCVQSSTHKIVFLVKSPLILAAVVDTDASVTQLLLQLVYVNSQVESVSTRAALQRHYSKRRNCDLRDLLGGTDRLISSLLDLLDTEPGLMLGAYHSLPLPTAVRNDVSQAIVNACAKIKNVVFGVVLTGLQVVAIVRLKGVVLHPADLHLLCNLINATNSLRASENWMPICLPQFDPDGYLYGHVSYLCEGCDACLLLLTVDREHFLKLFVAKQKITERLRRQHVLEKLVTAYPPLTNQPASEGPPTPPQVPPTSAEAPYTTADVGCPQLRHFVYKNRALAQYTAPAYTAPYHTAESRLLPCRIYQRLQQRLHGDGKPLKMLYMAAADHAAIGWVTAEFELYAVLEPLATKQAAIVIVNKILKYVKQEEARLFIQSMPTF